MCGKTNMAKALANRLGIPYFKNKSEHTYFGQRDTEYFVNASKYIDSYMASFLLKTGTSVVLDRAWPSEYVYPKVFGRAQDPDVLVELDKRWSWLDTKIIVPFRSSYDGIVDDTHPQINSDRLRELDDLYLEFTQWSRCKTLRLNVDDEDLGRELREIIKFVTEP